ncbi:hypothetical protein EZV62_019647 [Acer yangbiense]|uniref:K-box domain-containing protein n=1 Tax=Acer yangbiense TaxID=1000413 RepID=A0A5C7HBU9_9ROSI|nr:hypothetical protein EZV62_019647 [Acer yangbiense]
MRYSKGAPPMLLVQKVSAVHALVEMERIIARYRNEVGLPHSTHEELRTVEVESWKSEIAELEKSINILETRLRHFSGEDISNLGVNELKQLERQLKIGMDRILSKKQDHVISEEINLLKNRETDLQEENLRLQQRVRTEKLLIFYESGAWRCYLHYSNATRAGYVCMKIVGKNAMLRSSGCLVE